MNTPKLPPLPKAKQELKVKSAAGQEWAYPAYSEAEMQAYALAAIEAQPGQPVVQPEQPATAESVGWKAHAEAVERERDYWRRRAQAMHEHQRGQVWYWQGDGEDHLESLCNSLPVVIRADALRSLVQPAPAGQGEPVAAIRGGKFQWLVSWYQPGDADFYAHPQPERVALTDEQWLELLLREADGETLSIAAIRGESIQTQGRWVLLNAGKKLKTLIERAHGIKGAKK